MRHLQRHEISASTLDDDNRPRSTQLLDGDLICWMNDQIEGFLRNAFAPHRCEVEFQEDRQKVAVTLHTFDGREFFVEAKRVKSLREPSALAEYVRDVKACLSGRNIVFNNGRARATK